MRLIKNTLIIFSLLTLIAVNQANAFEQFYDTNHSRAALSLATDRFDENNQILAKATIFLQPGWHTYWQNPGDSGAPLTVETLPEYISATDFLWPVPKKLPLPPLMNFGYENQVTVFFNLVNNSNNLPENLQVKLNYLVCKDLCIPQSADFNFALNTANNLNKIQDEQLITEKLKLENIKAINGEFNIENSKVKLYLNLADLQIKNNNIKDLFFFPDQNNFLNNSATQDFIISQNSLIIYLPINNLSDLNNISGVLKIRISNNQEQNFNISAQKTNISLLNTQQDHQQDQNLNLILAMAFALIGGIILNLMPCVFPILALKVFSFAKHAKQSFKHRLNNSLSYTVGILSCFSMLAAIIIFIKNSGQLVGWGFQMQSPIFVTVMLVIIFILGLVLLGVYELYLPINFSLPDETSANKQSELANSFLTGLLITLVATPCTAPLMAPAIGFALTQNAFSIFLVFLSLGLGLALPFILISLIPKVGDLLPHPGNWMLRFKQFLAFLMFLTCVWLIWILSQMLNPNSIGLILASLVLLSLGVWILGLVQSRKSKFKFIAWLIIILAGFSIYLGLNLPKDNVKLINFESQTVVISFDQAIIDSYLAKGESVFVNVTAAWCITCKANEKLALNSNKIIDYFNANNINYLKIDWTNSDPVTLEYLNKFNRAGVPLYVFYQPNKQPIVLPQILTPSIILKNIT